MSKHYAAAEITVPLPKWAKARRFVFIRETLQPKVIDNQLCFDLKTYDHQVIVTSNDKYSPEEVWHKHNKRCNIENKIDELKVGLGFEKMSQEEMKRNIAFMWLKVLSYNLLNWFRLALLGDKDSHAEVSTIRRKILNIPGNVVGNNRYRHITLAPNPWLMLDNNSSVVRIVSGSDPNTIGYSLICYFVAIRWDKNFHKHNTIIGSK